MHKKVIFKSYCQNQQFLLPKDTNDFISKGHIARLISCIIDKMDTTPITLTYRGGGTSSYNPKMLLKVWILGFINRVYSCRLLAKELRENLAYIWISGNQQPDFRTLNNFRLRLKDEIKKVFKEIVIYGIENKIIEGKDVFIDHTKNEANSNKHKIVWKKQVDKQLIKIDEELDELFKYIDGLNEDEEKIFGNKDLPEQERDGFDKEKMQDIIDKINNRVREDKITKEKAKEDKKKVRRVNELIERKENYNEKKEILGNRNSYSKTDHDAVGMMMKDKITIRPAYNEGVAVENGFILDYIISDSCADNKSFIPLMEGVIDNIGKTPENVHADGAYGNEETMSYIEEMNIENFLKYNSYYKEKTKKGKENNRFEGLIYDKEKDEFTCLSGIKIKFERENIEVSGRGYERKIKIYKSEEGDCDKCNFHKSKVKSISISWKFEKLRDQARSNLNSIKGIELRKRRGNEVESVFGDEKLNKLKKRYHLRGMVKVNIEAGLFYLAHNMRKINSKDIKEANLNKIKSENNKINIQKLITPAIFYPP